MILAMGIAYGGLAQIIAGIMEYKNGNTFGTVAFTSYGCFWLSLIIILILPNIAHIQKADPTSMGIYFIMWGIFTIMMFIGTLKATRGSKLIFLTLAILFFLLTLAELTGIHMITIIAGYEGILTGLIATYVGLAEVINEEHDKTMLPI